MQEYFRPRTRDSTVSIELRVKDSRSCQLDATGLGPGPRIRPGEKLTICATCRKVLASTIRASERGGTHVFVAPERSTRVQLESKSIIWKTQARWP